MKNLENVFKWSFFGVAIILGLFLFLSAHIFLIPTLQDVKFRSASSSKTAMDTASNTVQINQLTKEIGVLQQKISRFTPGGAYLIINTTENSFRLFKNNELVRKGKCSTGSLIQLELDSTKSWTFETPKGALSVKNKITDPIWRKPDWAFIEEGLAVPSANHTSRFERGVLGDYALILGDGYMIHGTLYQRLLGLPVTHGCIRLADEDLEVVYKSLPVGSKVFIY